MIYDVEGKLGEYFPPGGYVVDDTGALLSPLRWANLVTGEAGRYMRHPDGRWEIGPDGRPMLFVSFYPKPLSWIKGTPPADIKIAPFPEPPDPEPVIVTEDKLDVVLDRKSLASYPGITEAFIPCWPDPPKAPDPLPGTKRYVALLRGVLVFESDNPGDCLRVVGAGNADMMCDRERRPFVNKYVKQTPAPAVGTPFLNEKSEKIGEVTASYVVHDSVTVDLKIDKDMVPDYFDREMKRLILGSSIMAAKEQRETLRPLGDNIVVRREDTKDRSEGGVLLPERSQEKPLRGRVIAVGPGKPSDVERDVIVFNYPAGNDDAREAAYTNAKKVVGKIAIAVPRGGTKDDWPAVEMIARPLAVKTGDVVFFTPYAGTEVEIGGETLLVLREADILGVVETK